jgi:hypothetical protein
VHTLKDKWDLGARWIRGFMTVLRAAGETTKTMQENIQHWLQLDKEDTGFQLLVLL